MVVFGGILCGFGVFWGISMDQKKKKTSDEKIETFPLRKMNLFLDTIRVIGVQRSRNKNGGVVRQKKVGLVFMC